MHVLNLQTKTQKQSFENVWPHFLKNFVQIETKTFKIFFYLRLETII